MYSSYWLSSNVEMCRKQSEYCRIVELIVKIIKLNILFSIYRVWGLQVPYGIFVYRTIYNYLVNCSYLGLITCDLVVKIAKAIHIFSSVTKILSTAETKYEIRSWGMSVRAGLRQTRACSALMQHRMTCRMSHPG